MSLQANIPENGVTKTSNNPLKTYHNTYGDFTVSFQIGYDSYYNHYGGLLDIYFYGNNPSFIGYEWIQTIYDIDLDQQPNTSFGADDRNGRYPFYFSSPGAEKDEQKNYAPYATAWFEDFPSNPPSTSFRAFYAQLTIYGENSNNLMTALASFKYFYWAYGSNVHLGPLNFLPSTPSHNQFLIQQYNNSPSRSSYFNSN